MTGFVGTNPIAPAASRRAYTGHENVEGLDIIHMNGRIYDATLARFMQADPIVQAPTNSQSYNRYSYVFNNPLSYTDPSGYSAWTKFRDKVLKPVAAIAITVWTGGLAAGYGLSWAGFGIAAAGGAASGFIVTGSLKGALTGAFSGAAFFGIGQYFQGLSAVNTDAVMWEGAQLSDYYDFGGNLMTGGQVAGQIASHAMTGGIISVVSGGEFGHGFVSAGVTKGIGTPVSDRFGQGISAGVVTHMAIGGTVSALTGGKFANGAKTAAYQFAFNHAGKALVAEGYAVYERAQRVDKVVQILKKMGKLSFAEVAGASQLLRDITVDDARKIFPHLSQHSLIADGEIVAMSLGFRRDVGFPAAISTGTVLVDNFLETLPPSGWSDNFLTFMDMYTSVYGVGQTKSPHEIVKWYGTEVYWKDRY